MPDVEAIIAYTQDVLGVKLCYEYDEPTRAPLVGKTKIWFNGASEKGHETFVITRARATKKRHQWDDNPSWSFCKTARKPYDIAVTAILAYLSAVHESHSVSSDGDSSDWLAGVELVRKAVPRVANIVDVPIDILREERWVSPWVGSHSTKYEFHFCKDGKAYLFPVGHEEVSYVFPDHASAAAWVKTQPALGSRSGCGDQLAADEDKAFKALYIKHIAHGRTGRPPLLCRPGEFPPLLPDRLGEEAY